MAATRGDITEVELAQGELWKDGPPYELFKEMRSKCPVHWTGQIEQYPTEAGFWSVTTADDVHAVSRDWETYSSELGGVTVFAEVVPARARPGDVHRHGPAQARQDQGPLPARLHAQADRRPRGPHPRDRLPRSSTASRAGTAATSSATSPSRSSRA